MKAIGYIRVSTEEQALEGVSLEAQKERIEAYAQLYGLELVAWGCDEGLSGGTLDRPGLGSALERLRRGEAEALVVAKLDRLTRSLPNLLELISEYFNEFALLSVAEQLDPRTASGRLVMNILGAVAQWELETISERTKEALRHKRENGEYTGGGVPYGFRVVGGKLIKNSHEQTTIIFAKILHDQGCTLREIADELQATGYRPRSGGFWTSQQIKRIIENGG